MSTADLSPRRCKHRLPPGLLLILATCVPLAAVAASPSVAARPSVAHAKLRQLDVSAGRWVYHGYFLGGDGARRSAWTWHEDCRWSDNHVFMLCSFSNTWGGRHVDSVVVDTYDPQRDAFWHYEVFDSGSSAGKPFAARMRIDGPTRTEAWTETRHGKSIGQRIVYEFASANRVTVQFQQSKDGTHWRTMATGTGERAGAGGAAGTR